MKFRLLAILLLSQLISFSQEKEIKEITTYPNSVIQFNWYYNSFTEVPKVMALSPSSMGIDVYALGTVLGKKSFVSLAIGAGFSVQNYKSDTYIVNSDSSYFLKIPKDITYHKNKIAIVFVDIPIELRFRSRPTPRDKAGIVRKRNFRFAVGFKVGYSLQRYLKYDGKDYRNGNNGTQIKYKEYRLKNFLLYRYGVYSKIGIGKVSIQGYYSLTNLFIKDKGPSLVPFSIGLSINI